MNNQGISRQGNHIVSAINVLNFIKFQHVFARLKGSCKDFVASKLRHHECAPGIRVKGNIIDPSQPIREFRWHEHESLKEHKKAKHSREQGHTNDEMRNHVGNELRQCFGDD
jgi:hypothetical protein